MVDKSDIEYLSTMFVTRKECDQDMGALKAEIVKGNIETVIVKTKINYILAILSGIGAVALTTLGVLLNVAFGG